MFNKVHDSRIIFRMKNRMAIEKKVSSIFISLDARNIIVGKKVNATSKLIYSGPDKSISTVSELQSRSKDTEIEPQAFIIYPVLLFAELTNHTINDRDEVSVD